MDAETLRDGCDGRCEHADGPSLPVETARRLGCDASVVAIVEDKNGEPLNVGRKTRTIPPAIRRALFSRDKNGCRFPSCTNKHYVDGHHIKHWANGGETRLSNLVVLCRFHYRLVHEGGVDVQVLDDGALRFVVEGRAFDSPTPARQAAEHYRSGQDATSGNGIEQGQYVQIRRNVGEVVCLEPGEVGMAVGEVHTVAGRRRTAPCTVPVARALSAFVNVPGT